MSEFIKETGLVIEIIGDDAKVVFNRTSACGKCKACGMAAGDNQIVVTAQNKVNAKEGDRVEVRFTSKNALSDISDRIPFSFSNADCRPDFGFRNTRYDGSAGFCGYYGHWFYRRFFWNIKDCQSLF